MTLEIIGLSLFTTALGLAAHIGWWRISRPRDDAAVLLLLMGVLPWVLTVAGALAGGWIPTGVGDFLSTILEVMVPLVLLHTLIAFVYMSCYTAAQAASPTVLIMLACLGRPEGLTREQLLSTLDDSLLCGDLVEAGLDEKLIATEDERLVLAPRGRFLLKLGRTLRNFLKLHEPVG